MWIISIFIFYVSIDVTKSAFDYLQHTVKSCHIGDVVENECNKCLCTSKSIFECTSLNCDKKNTKEVEGPKQLCYPNQLYVKNLITCICTKDGRWPHKSCLETFQLLPTSSFIKFKCTPNTYVPIDCNVCRCGPDGEIISDRCTRNACDDDIQRRANFGPNSVYSNCEVKNWYSLAPCQFCYCVNSNKLVCNTGNYYSKKLELGSYNLRVCGKELIREAIELIPDNQRMLRFGYGNSSSPATQRAMTTTIMSQHMIPNIQEDHNVAIEVNRESNENKTTFGKPVKQEEVSSSKEYYTDSEEEVAQAPAAAPQVQQAMLKQQSVQNFANVQKPMAKASFPTTRTTAGIPQAGDPSSTKFPIEEGDEMLNESGVQEEDVEDDSSDIVVELDQAQTTTSKTPPMVALHAAPDNQQVQNQPKVAKSAESYQYIGNTLKINLPKVLNKVFQLALRKSMVSLSNETKCTPGTTSVNDCNMCFCLKNSKLLCTNNKCANGKKVERNS